MIYLLVIGDAIADDPAAWRRSRATLLTVDQKIAGLQEVSYTVRLLEGDEESLRGELRAPGHLSRRDIRGPVSDADFSAVLDEIGTLARRDMRSMSSGKPMNKPAVLFFASEPPLADSFAAETFDELAKEATIIWVIPKEMKPLLASAFARDAGAYVVEDGEGAAEDIVDLLTADSSPDT